MSLVQPRLHFASWRGFETLALDVAPRQPNADGRRHRTSRKGARVTEAQITFDSLCGLYQDICTRPGGSSVAFSARHLDKLLRCCTGEPLLRRRTALFPTVNSRF